MQLNKVFVRADDFDLNELFDLHDNRKQALLRGILLSRTKGKDGIDSFNFIHKSILEYFSCQSGIQDIGQILKGLKQNSVNIFNETIIIDQGLI